MKISRLSQSLDGGNVIVLMHGRKAQAGVHTPTVDVDRAGSALAVVTALFCACQLRAFAQAIQQGRTGINLQGEQLAVYAQSDRNGICNHRVIRVRILLSRQGLC